MSRDTLRALYVILITILAANAAGSTERPTAEPAPIKPAALKADPWPGQYGNSVWRGRQLLSSKGLEIKPMVNGRYPVEFFYSSPTCTMLDARFGTRTGNVMTVDGDATSECQWTLSIEGRRLRVESNPACTSACPYDDTFIKAKQPAAAEPTPVKPQIGDLGGDDDPGGETIWEPVKPVALKPRAVPCQLGTMRFHQGARVFRVTQTAFHSEPYQPDAPIERTVFRGKVSGKVYTFDVIRVPGNLLPGDFSKAGPEPGKGGLPVKWNLMPPNWHDGDSLTIMSGPLPGDWITTCRW